MSSASRSSVGGRARTRRRRRARDGPTSPGPVARGRQSSASPGARYRAWLAIATVASASHSPGEYGDDVAPNHSGSVYMTAPAPHESAASAAQNGAVLYRYSGPSMLFSSPRKKTPPA